MKKNLTKLFAILLAVALITACGQTTDTKAEAKKESVETKQSTETTGTKEVEKEEAKEEEVTNQNYPVSIKTFDYERNHVEMVFDKTPEKVITVGTNSVENMIALGLEDKIIVAMGVKAEKILPKYKDAFNKIPQVSKEILSREDTLMLQPDLVLGWYSTFADKRLGDVPFWNERDVKTYMAYNSACAREDDADYVTANYIEREYLDILNIGKMFNVQDKAEAIVNEMKAKVEKGKSYAKISDPKKVVVIEDEGNVFRVYGEDTIGGQIAAELGANLVAKTRKEKKSAEELIDLNPDIVFSVHFGATSTSLNDKNCLDFFENNPALKNIEAYKTGALVPTDLSLVYSPGVRLLESYDFFIEKLYPEFKEQSSYYPIELDTYNSLREPITLTIEKAPEKVYVACQNNIEIMLRLGLEDKIAACYGLDGEIAEDLKGVFETVNYLEKGLPKEDVIAMEPDCIIGWSSLFSDKRLGSTDYWHEKGTNTYMALNSACRPRGTVQKVEDEMQDILNIGKIFNVQDKAQQLVKEIEVEIEKVQKYIEGKEKVEIAVLEDESDSYRVYGANTLGGDVAVHAGAKLKVGSEGSSNISAEDLVAANPEAIFMVWYEGFLSPEEVVESITKNPAFASLDAVKNDKVFPLNLTNIYCSGLRTKDGVWEFAKKLYPELYQ